MLPSSIKTHIFHIMLPHMDKIYPMLIRHFILGLFKPISLIKTSFSHSSSGIMEHYKIHYQIIHIVGTETIARTGILTNYPFYRMKGEKLKKLLSIIFFLHFALLRILNLSNTRISVLQEVEEFLVMLYGFGFSVSSIILFLGRNSPLARRLKEFYHLQKFQAFH